MRLFCSWLMLDVSLMLLLFSGVVVRGEEVDCVFDSEGVRYDLTPLMRDTDYIYLDNDWTVTEYTMNICKSAAVNPTCTGEHAAYYVQYNYCTALGELENLEHSLIDTANPDAGIMIEYSAARTDCYLNGANIAFKVDISIICKPDADPEKAELANYKQNDACHYSFDLESPHGCPSGGGFWSLGSMIFLLTILIGGFLYFVGGIALATKGDYHEVGVDKIPHVEFWTGLPGDVMAGIAVTQEKVVDLVERIRG